MARSDDMSDILKFMQEEIARAFHMPDTFLRGMRADPRWRPDTMRFNMKQEQAKREHEAGTGPHYTHFSFDLGVEDFTAYQYVERDDKNHCWRFTPAEPSTKPQYNGFHSDIGEFLDLSASEFKRIPDLPKITKG